MNADDVIQEVESPKPFGPERRISRIFAGVDPREIAEALRRAEKEHTRVVLSGVTGYLRVGEAVPVLIEHLSDPSVLIRADAAESLGKIGDQRAGRDLLAAWRQEQQSDARTNMVWAFEGVRYRPAVPDLVAALDDPDPRIPPLAASALSAFNATEARDALLAAYGRRSQRRSTCSSSIAPRSAT